MVKRFKPQWITWVLGGALIISSVLTIWLSWRLSRSSSHEQQVIALVGDHAYTLQDLETQHRDVFQKRQQLYLLQKEKIKSWQQSTVLFLEAQRRGVDTTALIEEALKAAQLSITDQEVKDLIRRFGKIYPDPKHPEQKTFVPETEAKQYLEHVQRQRVWEELAGTLLEKYPHSVFLKEPHGPRIEEDLALPTRPSLGPPTAKVKVVIFSDFECPFCKRLALGPLKEVQTEFGDRVFWVYRDLPIAHHKYAYHAAIAAKCAARQGKFWPYHDQLFQNQHALDRENLIALATDVGLNLGDFKNCLLDKTIEAQVEEDISVAAQYDLRATPTLIINGEVIEGAISTDVLKEKIHHAH